MLARSNALTSKLHGDLVFALHKPLSSSENILVAAEHGHLDVIIKLASADEGCELIAKAVANDKTGDTVLHKAIRHGRKDIVNFLTKENSMIREYMFVDAINKQGDAAIHLATARGSLDLIELLVANGANINLPGALGDYLPVLAAAIGHERIKILQYEVEKCGFRETAIHTASRFGHIQIVLSLIHLGADVAAVNSHDDLPIHVAAMSGHEVIVSNFLSNGVPLEAQGRFGRTPLHCAVRSGKIKVVWLLLHRGANVNAKEGYEENTPLHLAAHYGHAEIVEILLENGAELNGRNADEETPLDCAMLGENKLLRGHIVNLLVKQGADESLVKLSSKMRLCRGNDGGRDAWHYVLVRPTKLQKFESYGRGLKMDIDEFGEIVKSGWGRDPPKDVQHEMEKVYGANQLERKRKWTF